MRSADTESPASARAGQGRAHGAGIRAGTRVLGIDPGSRATGYGVVERPATGAGAPGDRSGASSLRHVAHGTLRPPEGLGLAERLAFLHAGIAEVIERHAPAQVVVEQVFVSASARSALVLGQARGAVLAAAAGAGLDVHELSAREIKKSVVGTGGAAKSQVQAMVSRLLGLDRKPAQDAADALAAAICRAHASASVADGLGLRGGRGRRRGRAGGRFVVRRSP
ncbi:MAG: crossover junction endodeoxyribonuclease RuvC [Myxococcota bacterium]